VILLTGGQNSILLITWFDERREVMVQSCIIVGCTSRWSKDGNLSWHRVPAASNTQRRNKWISAINRKNWEPRDNDRVCGKHFLSGTV